VSHFIPRDHFLGEPPVTKLTAVRTPTEIIVSVEDQFPLTTGGGIESELANVLGSFHLGLPKFRISHGYESTIVPI
jgi:hypothetical protein